MEVNDFNKKRKKPVLDNSITFGKIPPQAKSLEEQILGAIIFEGVDLYIVASEILKSNCFYVEIHQKIFSCFTSLVKKNQPIDLLTVVEELKFKQELDFVGGAFNVTKISNTVVSTANIEAHCKIVLQKFIARELIRVSGEIICDAYEDSNDSFDLLDESTNKYQEINNGIAEKSNVNIDKICFEVVNELSLKQYNAINDIVDGNLILTGIKEWDKINGSLMPYVYIIAARPAMGKGAHMVQCVSFMANNRYKVGVINGEMSNKQLIIRLGCNILGIDNYLWKKNPKSITKEDIELVNASMEATQALDWYLDDTTDIDKACNKIKLWVKKYGVQVVFMDVLSKFKPPEHLIYKMTDVQKLNYVMDKISDCSKYLGIPILVYAHLNRELYKRANKEPNMSDLKGSGNIEDFAFQVSFLHRPEYYDANSISDEMGESTKGLMYQIIEKHRDGETGRIKLKAELAMNRLLPWENNFTQGWSPIQSKF
jgi:replicative DNA helicase